jgi:hypothetical protein
VRAGGLQVQGGVQRTNSAARAGSEGEATERGDRVGATQAAPEDQEERRKVKGAGYRGATVRASHKDATAPHCRKEERETRAANARLRDWLEDAQHELEIQQQVATKALMQEQLLREENCRQSRLLLKYDKEQVKLWGELWRLRHPTDAEPEDHISGAHSRASYDQAECPICRQEMQETVALEPTQCYECKANVQEGASMMWCETCYLVICAQCRGTQEEGAEAEGAQD